MSPGTWKGSFSEHSFTSLKPGSESPDAAESWYLRGGAGGAGWGTFTSTPAARKLEYLPTPHIAQKNFK